MISNTELKQEARKEAMERYPTYFANAVGDRELERWDIFQAGALWAAEKLSEERA